MTNHPALDHPTTEISSRAICACGSDAFFFSEMDPSGYFCEECGKPDPFTQRKLETEEPGYWGL
jgi:hypothetical protein